MENASLNEEKTIYRPKRRFDGLLAPFRKFSSTFKESSPYRKVAMIINLILPGFGNMLIGCIEMGLVFLSVFALLFGGTIYLAGRVSGGAILTSALTNVIVFGLLVVGILAIYYSSFKASVFLNARLNEKEEIKSFVIYRKIKGLCLKISSSFKENTKVFHQAKGREKTMLITSFFVMGLPLMVYKEFIKGIVYFLIQMLFIFYMIARGVSDIQNFFILGTPNANPLVFGIIAFVFVLLFIIAYVKNYQNMLRVVKAEQGEGKLESVKDEIHQLTNKKFYLPSLLIPVGGALLFTVIPLAFMIIVAFSNYSLVTADGYNNLDVSKNIFLQWVGLETFKRVFYEGANLQDLLSVFSWTMIWATIATFSCYFGGLFLAMLLNKKSVKGKIIWRSMFVIAMAMPQFVSLLIMRTMFMDYGPLNQLLQSWGLINEFIPFWENEFLAKMLILFINMWVGIPYYMLLMSGLLINIPNDYYEAARIEGASKWQMFKKITFPNILYMTTPLLITSFVSNINNFNVIYFLTNGGTISSGVSNTAFKTDILITWLYTLTMKRYDYNFGAAIGIVMFIISATLSLIVFRRSKAYNNEEAFR